LFGLLVDELIDALRCSPGVGPKSAQRMALHILERDRLGGARLSGAIANAVENVGSCSKCQTLSKSTLCEICANPRRDSHQLCVLETPADLFAIEQSSSYRGHYFVLMGHLSPIDGIGPEELGINRLLDQLIEYDVNELILATNLTIEGEATAHYISERAKSQGVMVSRIAHGVPLGGELEYVDGGTLAHAFTYRKQL
jgi:recombination protein RecR